jgi:hypothetical protein
MSYSSEEPIVEHESFWDRMKRFFRGEEAYEPEVIAYKRRFWDSRIERYLDENFDSYIVEYNLVTKKDLIPYEDRCKVMEDKLRVLDDFTLDIDAKLTDLEHRIEILKKKKK